MLDKINKTLEEVLDAVKNSNSRLDVFKKLNIESSTYKQKILNKFITNNNNYINIDHFDRTFKRINYSDPNFIVDFKLKVAASSSFAELLLSMGRSSLAGGTIATLKKFIAEKNISTSHFVGQAWNKNKKNGYAYPLEDYFSNKRSITSHKLRLRLLDEGLFENKCTLCQKSEWNNQPIPLTLDHKNGDHYDNTFENLQILCASCHSSTDNFRGANIGKANASLKTNKLKKEKLVPILKSKEQILLFDNVKNSQSIQDCLKLFGRDDTPGSRAYLRSSCKEINIDLSHWDISPERKEILFRLTPMCNSFHELKNKIGSGSYKKIHQDIKTLNISIEHFKNKRNKNKVSVKYTIQDVLDNKHYIASCRLHKMLKGSKLIDYKCKNCFEHGMETVKNLELDHIDGNNKNNSLDNLRFLCPNCHSQTDTYGGKNKGKQVKLEVV